MAVKKTTTPDPIIILNDIYQIQLDKKCYILQKKTTSDDKELSKEEQKDGFKILGYYTTWESLGKSLMQEITRDKAIKKKEDKLTITNFINVIKEVRKEVVDMFKDIDKQMEVNK